jgi:hypothetical protein
MNVFNNIPEPTYKLKKAFISFHKTVKLLHSVLVLTKKILML